METAKLPKDMRFDVPVVVINRKGLKALARGEAVIRHAGQDVVLIASDDFPKEAVNGC